MYADFSDRELPVTGGSDFELSLKRSRGVFRSMLRAIKAFGYFIQEASFRFPSGVHLAIQITEAVSILLPSRSLEKNI